MVVVPKDLQIHGAGGVAQQFFELSLGTMTSSNTGKRIFNALLAVSSLGNIIVMTYTAARVKQEIAKEGILPFAKFFAQNKDLSVGRLLRWCHNRGYFSSIARLKWLSPEAHSDKTPVGALVLHMVSCLVLIMATWKLEPDEAYTLLTSTSSYVINAFSGTFLALGILILRFRGTYSMDGTRDSYGESKERQSWSSISRFNPGLSITCALIYMVGNLFPIVTTWIKPSDDDLRTRGYGYWVTPTIACAVIGAGVSWFLGFVLRAWHINRKHHKVFVVEKKPEFESAEPSGSSTEMGGHGHGGSDGGYVLVHETVYLSWVGKETLRARRPDRGSYAGDEQRANEDSVFKGTDFDGFYQAQLQQQQKQQHQFHQEQRCDRPNVYQREMNDDFGRYR
jgi:amino acid transporter